MRTFRFRSSLLPSRASVVASMNCSSSFSSLFSNLSGRQSVSIVSDGRHAMELCAPLLVFDSRRERLDVCLFGFQRRLEQVLRKRLTSLAASPALQRSQRRLRTSRKKHSAPVRSNGLADSRSSAPSPPPRASLPAPLACLCRSCWTTRRRKEEAGLGGSRGGCRGCFVTRY